MSSHHVNIPVEDDEIWVARKTKLQALRSRDKPHDQVQPNGCAWLTLRFVLQKEDVDELIRALEECSADEMVCLSNTIYTGMFNFRNSLLHHAVRTGKCDILQALLEVIHDRHFAGMANYRGDTPLHVAARAGRYCMADLLLDCGNIVDKPNEAGNTALHEAVKNGDDKLTNLLLRKGSKSVCQKNKERKCPLLYLAVELKDSTILSRLLHEVGANEVPQGMSPVHGALMHRRLGKCGSRLGIY